MLSSPNRSIVNGNMLRRFLNQKVNIMVNIEDVDSNGKTLKGMTTDQQSIQVCLSEPVTSLINGWVEVIGVPTGSDRINCEEVSNALSLWNINSVYATECTRNVQWLIRETNFIYR